MAILPPDPVFCLRNDMGYIHSLCFPDLNGMFTSQLFAASETGFVHIWDLETNRSHHKQKMGESIQAIHSAGSTLITQEKEGSVKLWEFKEGSGFQVAKTYRGGGGYCKSILFDEFLVVPQEHSSLDVVHIKEMECIKCFKTDLPNLGLAMCLQKVEINDAIYILAGFESGDILLWNFISGEVCSHLKLRECMTSLTFDPVTGKGVCGNISNVLEVFTIDRSFKLTLKCEIMMTNDGCTIVKLRPDRKIFVAGGSDGRLRLFSWKSLRLLAVLNEHWGSVTDVQFSTRPVKLWNSNIMAASGADGVISLWNLYN